MESFVRDYLETAADDPDAGFALLTSSYQVESNGLEGYEGFWGNVSNVRVNSIQADVADLTVTYNYSYNFRGGGKRTETVGLELEQTDDGGYLIAGET